MRLRYAAQEEGREETSQVLCGVPQEATGSIQEEKE
jgi:hypothetical protein